MSARNMVRNLRDSGELAARPKISPLRSAMMLGLAAAFSGAVLYFGAAYGVPVLMKAVEKKPPALHFAKPIEPGQH